MSKHKEIRVLALDSTELRVERDEGEPSTITGYAAVFDRESENLGGFKEIIRPGAFRKVLETCDCRALFNHDPNFVLGRSTSGTLSLEENRKGLKFSVFPPDNQTIRDLVVSPIQRGDITGCSFAFTVAKDGDSWSEKKGLAFREIHEISGLYDVSPVTYPAYPSTDVTVRSAQDVYDAYAAKLAQDRKERQRALSGIRKRRVRLRSMTV